MRFMDYLHGLRLVIEYNMNCLERLHAHTQDSLLAEARSEDRRLAPVADVPIFPRQRY